MADIIIRRDNAEIGNLDADNDDFFLKECFVEIPAYHEIIDEQKNKFLLLGKTGSGKTAIINKIRDIKRHNHQLDLIDISVKNITGSNIISILSELNADLSVLFQVFLEAYFNYTIH